jgi:hypothetical protein
MSGFEEGTIAFGVLAVAKKMHARNHCDSILTSREMNSLNTALWRIEIYWVCQ